MGLFGKSNQYQEEFISAAYANYVDGVLTAKSPWRTAAENALSRLIAQRGGATGIGDARSEDKKEKHTGKWHKFWEGDNTEQVKLLENLYDLVRNPRASATEICSQANKLKETAQGETKALINAIADFTDPKKMYVRDNENAIARQRPQELQPIRQQSADEPEDFLKQSGTETSFKGPG